MMLWKMVVLTVVRLVGVQTGRHVAATSTCGRCGGQSGGILWFEKKVVLWMRARSSASLIFHIQTVNLTFVRITTSETWPSIMGLGKCCCCHVGRCAPTAFILSVVNTGRSVSEATSNILLCCRLYVAMVTYRGSIDGALVNAPIKVCWLHGEPTLALPGCFSKFSHIPLQNKK